jgi:hypothetical protein
MAESDAFLRNTHSIIGPSAEKELNRNAIIPSAVLLRRVQNCFNATRNVYTFVVVDDVRHAYARPWSAANERELLDMARQMICP